MSIPIGLSMSKVWGDRMAKLRLDEKLRLLDIRHQQYQRYMEGRDPRYIADQQTMEYAAPIVEVLNSLLFNQFRGPAGFWLPNRPWREGDGPLPELNYNNLMAAYDICHSESIRREGARSSEAARARDALGSLLGPDTKIFDELRKP